LREHAFPNEESAYEQFEKKLVSDILPWQDPMLIKSSLPLSHLRHVQFNERPSTGEGNVVPTFHPTWFLAQADVVTEPSIMIRMSDMCSENSGINVRCAYRTLLFWSWNSQSRIDAFRFPFPHSVIPLGHTFGALAESLIDFDPEAFLPDVWSKASDPSHNRITKSRVCWEWQDPSRKVIDAINKDGHIAIETVCKEGEYLVALVKNGEMENGVPIGEAIAN
jgi:hypothetical protein